MQVVVEGDIEHADDDNVATDAAAAVMQTGYPCVR